MTKKPKRWVARSDTLRIRIDEGSKDRLKKLAEKEGLTLSRYVYHALLDLLDKNATSE